MPHAAVKVAADFDGVLTLGRLKALGYDHAAVGREVDNDRWMRLGTHTVALHTGPVDPAALRWRAVWEVAEQLALVDGVSALQAAGLTGYTELTRPSPAACRAPGSRSPHCGVPPGPAPTGRRPWCSAWRCSSA